MTSSEQSDPTSESNQLEAKSSKYERLRSWYLAHLRKSQLVGDIASGVTPAALIKRDREALERLIADTAPVINVKPTESVEVMHAGRRQLKPTSVLMVVNVIVAIWLVTGIGNPVITEFAPRLALAILFVLGSMLLYRSSKELNQTRMKLQAVTQREADIADYAYEAFWSIDGDYKFVAVNPAFERLFGSQNHYFVDTSLFAVIPDKEQERLRQNFVKAQESKQVEKFETQMLKGDGALVDLELTAEFSPSDDAFYCVAVDISQRKEVERLKEQLMAMLSHDLKTPLSSLRFSLALLGSSAYGELSEEGQGVLQVGENNVTRLIDLINQLLDLHKLDAHQLKLSLKDVPVSEIIQPALEAIESLAEQKNVDVTIEAEEISVRADKDRMLQVLINLLSNAIKYSPANSEVLLTVKKLKGDWLAELRVKDSGPGIAKAHRQLVFDRFYRVASEDGNTEEGTGLGLAISKAIVEAHGGKIYVESEPPNGSSFYCHIPAVKNKPA